MVTAYWLIGREIVVEIQGGEERAQYGKLVIQTLSHQLTKYYSTGFSITNLQYFRKVYQTWPDRLSIQHPSGAELVEQQKNHPTYGQFPTGFSSQLSEGYDPKLDDGVGKNITPLQKKGIIAYDLLNPGQLKKYLNADW